MTRTLPASAQSAAAHFGRSGATQARASTLGTSARPSLKEAQGGRLTVPGY
jgi:hypothetical protein